MYYIYGIGGHAKVIRALLCGVPEHQLCFMHKERAGEEYLGLPVVHPDLLTLDDSLVIAIGDNHARERVYNELSLRAYCPSIQHRTYAGLVIEEPLLYPRGNQLLAHSFIGPDVEMGKFCIINTAATVDHDCRIGDFVHIAPGVNLCGSVEVGDYTLVGAGSVVIPGIRIGSNTIIGAGSVVVKDIPDNVVAYGNPCRVRRENNV